VRKATLSDIDLAPVLQMKAGDTVMTEIIERYPNGNYKVRGTKRVPYRGGYRMLTMVAIAKSADIGEDDTIGSGKLYEYRLETLR
jgi:flagellar basal body L-ring protein FlgH